MPKLNGKPKRTYTRRKPIEPSNGHDAPDVEPAEKYLIEVEHPRAGYVAYVFHGGKFMFQTKPCETKSEAMLLAMQGAPDWLE